MIKVAIIGAITINIKNVNNSNFRHTFISVSNFLLNSFKFILFIY